MKKLVTLFIIIILFTTGCNAASNNPKKQVEEFFLKYQTLNSSIIDQLNDMVKNDDNLTEEQKQLYKDNMKRQYRDLTYLIKDEEIDGNNALVKVEVNVYDYGRAIEEADKYQVDNPGEFNSSTGEFDRVKFNNYKLNKMKEYKEKITYTLDISLTKVNDEWVIDTLSDTERQKINGIYKS